jgi:hypothetical protein
MLGSGWSAGYALFTLHYSKKVLRLLQLLCPHVSKHLKGCPCSTGWVFIMTLFTYFFIPETKGLLIEDVHEVFATHW